MDAWAPGRYCIGCQEGRTGAAGGARGWCGPAGWRARAAMPSMLSSSALMAPLTWPSSSLVPVSRLLPRPRSRVAACAAWHPPMLSQVQWVQVAVPPL